MRSVCLGVFALALVAGGAAAQAPEGVYSTILTIDQDRLFEQAPTGAARAASLEQAAAELAAENRRIEMSLIEEERALAESRDTMPADEFTKLANDFDARVQAIREEQDRKALAFNAQREEARQAFFVEIGDILSQIVVERGAVIVLDRRDVFISADQIDITDEAIARANARQENSENPVPDQ